MMASRAGRLGFVLAVAWCISSCASVPPAPSTAASPTAVSTVPEEFLANYRAAERAVLRDLHLSCSATLPGGGMIHVEKLVSADYRLRAARRGDDACSSMLLQRLPTDVEYVAPPVESRGTYEPFIMSAQEYVGEEMVFSLTHEEAFRGGDDGGEILKSFVQCRVAPDGSTRKVGTVRGRHWSGASARTFVHEMRVPLALFTGGRGYSECLDTITEVSALGNGYYRIRGRGTLHPYTERMGEFDLTIDVEHGYLVRECNYYVGYVKAPVLRIHATSEGVIGTGEHTIAKRGTFQRVAGRFSATFEFDSIGPWSQAAAKSIEADVQRLLAVPNWSEYAKE